MWSASLQSSADAYFFRIILLFAPQLFCSVSLDYLDGMQARKTGQCSKVGEALDHTLDSANVPLTAACILMLIMPDRYTIAISMVGGSMIYNAQLVIYRHHQVFILPPTTGPLAQAMASWASVPFGILIYLYGRDSWFVWSVINLFPIVGNIAQFQNCLFYGKRLIGGFDHSCLLPHLRFTFVMLLHAGVFLAGYLTAAEYMTTATVLAYRLNGKYVLDSLMRYKPLSASWTKQHIKLEDNDYSVDCLVGLVMLFGIAVNTGREQIQAANQKGEMTTFHWVFYAATAIATAIQIKSFFDAIPRLTRGSKNKPSTSESPE
jgi:phosphatidylglycerophosphate synthase